MVKRKKPTHNLITEALATADPANGLNPKSVLLHLNRTNSIDNDDENLALVKHMIQNGLNTNEFIQVKGNSINGFFKLNPDYQPIEQNLPPLVHVPPSPARTPEPPENLIKKRPRRKRVVKTDEIKPEVESQPKPKPKPKPKTVPKPNKFMSGQSQAIIKIDWDNSMGNVISGHEEGTTDRTFFDEVVKKWKHDYEQQEQSESNGPEVEESAANKDRMFKIVQKLKSENSRGPTETLQYLVVTPFEKDNVNSMIQYGIIPQLVRLMSHSDKFVSANSVGCLLKLTFKGTKVYEAMFETEIVDKLYGFIKSPSLANISIQCFANAANLTRYLSYALTHSMGSFAKCFSNLLLSCAHLLGLNNEEVTDLTIDALQGLMMAYHSYTEPFNLSKQEVESIMDPFIDMPVEGKQRFVLFFFRYISKVESQHVLVVLKAGLLDNLYEMFDGCKDYTETFFCLNMILESGTTEVEMVLNRGFVEKILPMMDDEDEKVSDLAYRFFWALLTSYTTDKLREKIGAQKTDNISDRVVFYLCKLKLASDKEKEELSEEEIDYEDEDCSFESSENEEDEDFSVENEEEDDHYSKLPISTVEEIIGRGVICNLVLNLERGSGIEKEQALQNLTEFTFSHNHCRAIIQLDVIPELVSLLHQDNKMASDSLQCLLNISLIDSGSCKTMFELDIEKALLCISLEWTHETLNVITRLALNLSEYLTETPTIKDFELKSMRIRALLLERLECKDAVVELDEAIKNNTESQDLGNKLIPLLTFIEEMKVESQTKKLILIGNYVRLNPEVTESIYNAGFFDTLSKFSKIEELKESALFCLKEIVESGSHWKEIVAELDIF